MNKTMYARTTQLRESTIDVENRSIEAVICTDSPVIVFDTRTWQPILEVLRMDGAEFPAQVPLLDTHDRSSITHQIGSTRDFEKRDGMIVARNYYAKTELGEHAWELVRGKHLTDNSIGYTVREAVDIQPGKSETVRGETYTAPKGMALRVSTSWQIKENSNCPIGADVAAKMRSLVEGPTTQHGVNTMITAAMRAWMVEHSDLRADVSDEDAQAHFDSLTEEERAACKAADTGANATRATATKPETETGDPIQAARAAAVEEMQRAAKAEQERILAIRNEAATNGIDDQTVVRCINEGLSIEDARSEFLNAIRAQQNAGNVAPQIRISGVQGELRHLEASLLLRANAADVAEQSFGDDITQQADERFRDMSLLDVTRMALQLKGHTVPVGREDTVRAGFSTGTLSILLGNTANKLMLKGYGANVGSWRQWCNIRNINDFKTHYMGRMNDLGELEQVGRGGEIKSSTRSQSYESIKLDTYARTFGVSRQDIIDDDMGVFTNVPQGHGVKAAQRVTKAVYSYFLGNPTMSDSVALFAAATGDRAETNLRTSLSLSADNLATAIQYFMLMTGPDGEPVELPPAYLMVPPSLKVLAEQLVNSTIIMPVGSTDAKYPTLNVAGGSLKGVIAEPRLELSTYTGYSATSWYLTADPAMADTIAVGFLNGQQNPTLETFGYDSDPNRLGITYRVYLDFGVAAADHRGMAKHTA